MSVHQPVTIGHYTPCANCLEPWPGRAYRHANAALGLGAAFRLTECPPAETGDWALETGNGMTITTTIGDPQ